MASRQARKRKVLRGEPHAEIFEMADHNNKPKPTPKYKVRQPNMGRRAN